MAKVQFTEPLSILNVIGLSPSSKGFFANLRKCIVVFTMGWTVISGLLELILNFKGLDSYTRACETAMCQVETVIRVGCLMIYKEPIADLMNECRYFWKLDSFGTCLENELSKSHLFIRKCLRWFRYMIAVATVLFMISGIYLYNQQPLIMCYGESKGIGSPYYELYFLVHTMAALVCYYVISGHDTLLFYLIGHLLSEVEMIKIAFSDHELECISDHNVRFQVAIKHHIFLLNFLQKFNEAYSTVMLILYTSGQFGVCFTLFVVFQYGMPPPAEALIQFGSTTVSYLIKSFIFCYGGQIITNELLELPNAIFYNKWNYERAFKNKGNLLCLQKAQSEGGLKLGPFGILKMEHFTALVKGAFSFFTFLNSFVDKS